jgi:hypothetical protein
MKTSEVLFFCQFTRSLVVIIPLLLCTCPDVRSVMDSLIHGGGPREIVLGDQGQEVRTATTSMVC